MEGINWWENAKKLNIHTGPEIVGGFNAPVITKMRDMIFEEFVKRQGGNISSLRVSGNSKVIRSVKSGIIKNIDALKIGMLSAELGSSAQKQGDKIDYGVGVVLHKTVGDIVNLIDAKSKKK